ncbi:MAG: dihydrolipoamide acetyltransferase family protein [Gudongella sp.]|nr:dihydrolipoamide acetyltransferase family protein [Gudongella sp.]
MKFEFKFPDIGEGIHEGVITKWLVEEGQEIEEGTSVAEVETDKVTTEIPAPKSGKISKLNGKKGDTIHVGDVFVVINTESGDSEEIEADKAPEKPNKKIEVPIVEEEETAGVVGEVIASSQMIASSDEHSGTSIRVETHKKSLATPVARAMAKDLGVDINFVDGTGPNGRVMKDDIKKASETKSTTHQDSQNRAPKPSPIAFNEELEERVPLTKIRQTIAHKMAESRFTIPHTTAMDEIDVSKLYEFRKRYKDIFEKDDIHLTFLPFIIKAVIIALKEIPEFNSTLDEEKNELILKHYYNIGIATDTDRGLMVPVIKNADTKSISDLAKAVEDLAGRSKDNKIELSELRGGCFSITNYGSIGGMFGIPIINYPEAAILGIGRIVKKPIVDDNDEIKIAYVLPLSLSYDHRTIDGASGARFLNLLKDLLSDPEVLLMKA